MEKSIELNLHLIQYCKDNGIPNEIPLERRNEYKGWYLVPLNNVEEIRIEIKKYENNIFRYRRGIK